jgi:hypothetical protein
MKTVARLALTWALLSGLLRAVDLTPTHLTCEDRTDPLGVDEAAPPLGWQVQGTTRGAAQTAWQVLAAPSPELLAAGRGDWWDSGRVADDRTFGVPYGGRPPASGQQVFWQVRVWDAAGRPSGWSAPTSWTAGVMEDSGWHAQWIGAPAAADLPLPMLRRRFEVRSGLKRATVNVCGLGQYELSLNGRKVGDQLLAPDWTKYDKTCLYDTYDVTAMLREGANAAGLLLGNGMFNVSAQATGNRYKKFTGSFGALQAIAQLRLEYADGRVEFVGTDGTWRVAAGPITFSSVYGGEDFDARLAPAGWDAPGFDDAAWLPATVVPGPGGKLRGLSVAAPPVGAHEVLAPVKVTTLRPGVIVYDFGQNAAQIPSLRVHGPAGSVVRLTPAELVRPNGTIDRSSAGGGSTYWQYTLDGQGTVAAPEAWFPRFFYSGYRYLQVELHPAAPDGAPPVVDGLESVAIYTDSTPVGEFACSNELFNRTRTLILWAQRSNLVSILTDCPHREKLGWLEQDYLNGPSLRYGFDLGPLMGKVLNDIADSQLPSGLVPSIAPEYTAFTDRGTPAGGRNAFGDTPEWGSALVQCAWQQYLWTGDARVLGQYYGPMQRYVAYLGTRRTPTGLIDYGLGDWYDLGPARPGKAQLTPVALTATATYYADLTVMEKAARLLGHPGDAAGFAQLADATRAAFNRAFFHADTGTYATGSQTANAMPLVLGLADPATAPRVVAALAADVQGRGNALTAGDIGYTYLLRALAAGDRSDVIYAMNNQSDKPGYGYQLAHGATALTEAWDAQAGSSQDHFMLGHIMEWFYRDLAGIGPDPDGPGFKKILIRPTVVGDLTWVRAGYDSVRGRIASDWKRDGQKFTLHVTIPANTTATVFVPTTDAASVQEDARPAAQSDGVKLLRTENQTAVFAVGSGNYTFTTTLP